jgi:dihydrofolate reductase
VSLTQYYTATTLDGFIADPDNSLDWLFTREREEDGPLNYGEFIADVGAMAMGSTTYEWILDHEFADKDPAEWKWPYDIRCWVFTHRQLPVVPDAGIEFTSADIATVHKEMVGAAGDRNVWIVGGEIWPVSSPTWGCWTRSSCRSRRSHWVGAPPYCPAGSSCV